jgi:hypothetical protein
VTAHASILRNVFLSLYLAHLNLNGVELGLKKPTKGSAGPETERSEGEGHLSLRCAGPISAGRRAAGRRLAVVGPIKSRGGRVPSRGFAVLMIFYSKKIPALFRRRSADTR